MMTAKHTPGPWTAAPIGSDTISITAGGYFIGEAYDMNRTPENRANAQLMATSPDLLAALLDLANASASREMEHRSGKATAIGLRWFADASRAAHAALTKATEVQP